MFWGTDRFPVGNRRKKAEENKVKQRGLGRVGEEKFQES